MIQRRQSLYLFVVVVLGIVLHFLPVIEFTTPMNSGIQRMFELSSSGLTEQTDEYSYAAEELPQVTLLGVWGLTLATWLIPCLALVIVFCFKDRVLQARLCLLQAFLCMAYYGVLIIFVWFGKHNVAHDWDILFGACIPLICLVLTLMALRGILKDEALVRAADRLR